MQVQGAPAFEFDRLNRVFAELAGSHSYRGFQTAPDGRSGQITGANPNNAIIFNPPLIQYQQVIEFTVEQSASSAADAFAVIAKHLQLGPLIQMGIKLIYHGVVPDKDARAYVLNRLLAKAEQDLGDFSRGGNTWAGLKYVAPDAEDTATYTITIEPLLADNTLLYLDLDGGFLMDNTVQTIKPRIVEMHQYADRVVRNYLEKV